ncbi:MAG: hypothetical protein F6K31_03750 [Symploca sp. SIO2G7]|nr:hypothetical protein [Symploca sp. SIO2G7]
MTFDNTCKFLAETFTDDITAWLLGQSVALTRLETGDPGWVSIEKRLDSFGTTGGYYARISDFSGD